MPKKVNKEKTLDHILKDVKKITGKEGAFVIAGSPKGDSMIAADQITNHDVIKITIAVILQSYLVEEKANSIKDIHDFVKGFNKMTAEVAAEYTYKEIKAGKIDLDVSLKDLL